MANLICVKCKQPIDEENLVECPHCWEMYHRECWEETKFCLTCKKFNIDFPAIQAQKEAENAENEQALSDDEHSFKEASEDDMDVEPDGRELQGSPVAGNMLLVSKVALITGIAAGVITAVILFMIKGMTGGLAGLAIGGVLAAIGWIASSLINGFGEVINNSQKNAYYLSKLVEKKDNHDNNFEV